MKWVVRPWIHVKNVLLLTTFSPFALSSAPAFFGLPLRNPLVDNLRTIEWPKPEMLEALYARRAGGLQ